MAVMRQTARSGYFFWASLLLLALALAGFARTFWLRAFLGPPPAPAPIPAFYVDVHGAMLLSWYAWLVAQAWQIRTGRTASHRKMGWVGAGIAAAIVLYTPLINLRLVGRLQSGGLDFESPMPSSGTPMLQFASGVIWLNLLMIAAFAGLVGAAVLLRKRPEVHKRLILIASILMIVPALSRIGNLLGAASFLIFPVTTLGLLLGTPIHDLLTRRRVHWATLVATAVLMAVGVGGPFIARTPFAQNFVRSLG